MMLISNRTHSVLEPMVSKTSESTSPVGMADKGAPEGGVWGWGAKSRGIGGRFFPLVVDASDGASFGGALDALSTITPLISSGLTV